MAFLTFAEAKVVAPPILPRKWSSYSAKEMINDDDDHFETLRKNWEVFIESLVANPTENKNVKHTFHMLNQWLKSYEEQGA